MALVAAVAGEVVGNLGLTRFTRPRRAHVGEIGMGVRDDWQGKGVGSALLVAALDLADNWLGLRRIELHVHADNDRAIALYRKFGFEVEGTHRAYAIRDGVYVELAVHGAADRRATHQECGSVSALVAVEQNDAFTPFIDTRDDFAGRVHDAGAATADHGFMLADDI